MFPERFVETQLKRFTSEGDCVFDPFSGRGTTLFESLLNRRNATAIDINPVAYCLSKAKAAAPQLGTVIRRIARLGELFTDFNKTDLKRSSSDLPPFFRRAFFHSTLLELLYLRQTLRWVEKPVDNFIAALVLGSLHGEMDRPVYFSNQMPRTICLKPDYSLRYWQTHGLFPQKREVFKMLIAKAKFRLDHGRPNQHGLARQGDARLASELFPEFTGRIRLVVTSPPYLNVTAFEEDQWLRLWFLGGEPNPTYGKISKDDRHQSAARYWTFLSQTWRGMAPLLNTDSVLVMRIGAKALSLESVNEGLLTSLTDVFPARRWLREPAISVIRGKQVRAFNPTAGGCQFETDFVYAPFASS
jgi:DNA methylase